MAVEWAVETKGLRKTYRTRSGRKAAVDGLDLRVPTGGVHGFLGPNGSGKTTTIRMLLGLVHADEGEMKLFGHEVPRLLNEVIGRVGAVVESPKFDPLRSGASNLWLLASSVGLPKTRVGEVLEIVELADRAKDRFRTYSLGMKQRLAVAATLLKNPDLLIFDEPTNGLDPAGIRDTRQLIRTLGDRGHAVLISSHLLAEIEQVADSVTIIARGKALYDGPLADLTHGGSLEDAFLRITEGVSVGEMGDGSEHSFDLRTLLEEDDRTSVKPVLENASKPSFHATGSADSHRPPQFPPRQAEVEPPLAFHSAAHRGTLDETAAPFSNNPDPTPDEAPAKPRRALVEDEEPTQGAEQ
jgi:ABC-2 type transport system ATP-binding protein